MSDSDIRRQRAEHLPPAARRLFISPTGQRFLDRLDEVVRPHWSPIFPDPDYRPVYNVLPGPESPSGFCARCGKPVDQHCLVHNTGMIPIDSLKRCPDRSGDPTCGPDPAPSTWQPPLDPRNQTIV